MPKCAEFSRQESYALNLRPSHIAGGDGLAVVGWPETVLEEAGERVVALPDGRLVSIGADLRRVSVNGRYAGSLSADFREAMADGDRIVLFTARGVEWIADGVVQGAQNAAVGVSLEFAPRATLSCAVEVSPKLSGSYARLNCALQQSDVKAFTSAFSNALHNLKAQAQLHGAMVEPSWVAWRIIDVEGKTIAHGLPQRFGELQGGDSVNFIAQRDGSTLTVSANGMMRVDEFTLRLRVERSESEFWRSRARFLELVLWRDNAEITDCMGRITEKSSSEALISATPSVVETERGQPMVAARFDFPLNGLDSNVFFSNLGEYEEAVAAGDDFVPEAVCYGGSLRVYALADEEGTVAVARADDPLTLRLTGRVCEGEILKICVPMGTGGGWNYGRHHFLVFTTAGIYALSIDSALKSMSAAPVSTEGIVRRDAVVQAADAIYCATASGTLLRLTGSRAQKVGFPLRPVALGWSSRYEELWAIDDDEVLLVLHKDGRIAARDVAAVRGFSDGGAFTSDGRLVSLNDELCGQTRIEWRKREVSTDGGLWRTAQFNLDGDLVRNLRLVVGIDGGGASRTVLGLTVNGEINEPIVARYRAPKRAYRTVSVVGDVGSSTRLVGYS